MALTTPILQSCSSWDATKGYTFKFNVLGGDQCVKNEIIIRNNSTNAIILDDTISSFNYEHAINAGALQNNITYNAQIFTLNASDTKSTGSNIILFTTHITPIISITNITNNIVNNSSYEFQGQYTQSEGELLSSYIYYLYDTNNELISSGDIKYDDLLKQTFSGLLEDIQYGIELKTVTAHGMEVSTGIIPFTVQYLVPQLPSALTLENLPNDGTIKISGSFIAISGKCSGTETYVGGEYIDLSSGNNVVFDEGIKIDNDFTIKIWVKNLANRQTFFLMENKADSTHKIRLVYFDNKIEVYQTSGSLTYYTYSNTISAPATTDLLCVWIQRKNSLIDIKLSNLGGG